MDVAILGENSIRLKGKNASIIIDPTDSIQKSEAEGIVFLTQGSGLSDKKVEGSRLLVQGPGEYEVGGIKISSTRVESKLVAMVSVDNLKVLFGSGDSIEKIRDKIDSCQVAVVKADGSFNFSMLPSLEASALIIYGSEKEEVQKSLGKEPLKANKYSTAVERLPDEMEFVLLG